MAPSRTWMLRSTILATLKRWSSTSVGRRWRRWWVPWQLSNPRRTTSSPAYSSRGASTITSSIHQISQVGYAWYWCIMAVNNVLSLPFCFSISVCLSISLFLYSSPSLPLTFRLYRAHYKFRYAGEYLWSIIVFFILLFTFSFFLISNKWFVLKRHFPFSTTTWGSCPLMLRTSISTANQPLGWVHLSLSLSLSHSLWLWNDYFSAA